MSAYLTPHFLQLAVRQICILAALQKHLSVSFPICCPPSLLPSFFLPPWKFIFEMNVLALKYFGFPCWKWFWSGRDSVQELSVRFFQNSQITWEHIEPLAYVPTFSCFPFVVKLSPKISVNSWTSFSGQIWTLLQALFTLYFDSLTQWPSYLNNSDFFNLNDINTSKFPRLLSRQTQHCQETSITFKFLEIREKVQGDLEK